MSDNKNRAVLTPSRIFTYGILVKNPILVQVIGLCPAVAACADIYAAAVLSAMILILLVSCELIASAFLKKTSPWLRIALYFVIGLAVSSAATIFCELYVPKVANTAGIYLPLMAASSAAALRCENFAVKKSMHLSFYDALANGIGTALVLLFTGFVRGLLGVGMIGDLVVFEKAPISGLAMPFGGFIMLGFSAALLKWFISTYLSDFSHDMSFGIKRTKKKKTSDEENNDIAKKTETSSTDDVSTVPENGEVSETTDTAEDTPILQEFVIDDFSLNDELDAIFAGLNEFESNFDEISSVKGETDDE